MNKKYLKIGLVVFFIIFITIVVIRKINIDNNLEESEIQPKQELETISKNEEKRFRKTLEDNTSFVSNKIKEENLNTNKNISMSNELLDKKDIENKNEKVLENLSLDNKLKEEEPNSFISTNNKEKVTKTEVFINKEKESILELESKLLNEITSIKELKKIKDEIKIIDSDKFILRKQTYKKGDKLGVFEVVNILPKKIKFKKSEKFFYSLRFYK